MIIRPLIVAAIFIIAAQAQICLPPCQHGGECRPADPEPNCFCPPQNGYAGDRCEVPICNPTCAAGTCIAPDVCNCTGTGFTGALCDQITCENPCLNGGSCVGPNQCDCTYTGYVGAACEIAVCDNNPYMGCINGGQCVAPQVCNCSTAPGWYGPQCQYPICRNECLHGGVCTAPDICDCYQTGFVGSVCEIDDNECQRFPPPCDSRTTCINVPGSYNCTACPSGYNSTSGDGKTNCTPVCSPPCANGGVCTAPNTCDCRNVTGFTGSRCNDDINECETIGCDRWATCTNTPGNFSCSSCPIGFSGNGYVECQAVCSGLCDAEGGWCGYPGNCLCDDREGYMGIYPHCFYIASNAIVMKISLFLLAIVLVL